MEQIFIMVFITFLGLSILVMWNKMRTRGKVLCEFVRKDKSVFFKLIPLENDFLSWLERKYEVYPDFVRVTRFPSGWPPFLQEVVPIILYDEEDAFPLDWINIDNRIGRAMELKAALDENWLRKLAQQSAEGRVAGLGIDFKRLLPVFLVGGVALTLLLMFRPLG